MLPSEVLKAARELLSDPRRWTKGAFARDPAGRALVSCQDGAVCWCASGALVKMNSGADYGKAAEYLRTGMRTAAIVQFNDATATTHADVLAAFDRAIALAASHGD